MTRRMTAEEVAAAIEADISGRESDWADGHDCASRVAARMIRRNLIESDDQRRERFERWIKSSGRVSRLHGMVRGTNCRYVDGPTNALYEAWQAALTYRDSEES